MSTIDKISADGLILASAKITVNIPGSDSDVYTIEGGKKRHSLVGIDVKIINIIYAKLAKHFLC